MSQPFLVMCLLLNVYLCRAEPVAVATVDVTPIGCVMNGMLFSMQLDMTNTTFKDSETGLMWKPRGIRCVQVEPRASELAARVKAIVSE